MSDLELELNKLIKGAKYLGLNQIDLAAASEYLEYNEPVLCFDQIVTQLYEYDIFITQDFYNFLLKIANCMQLPDDTYTYIKKSIMKEDEVPKVLKDELIKIIGPTI